MHLDAQAINSVEALSKVDIVHDIQTFIIDGKWPKSLWRKTIAMEMNYPFKLIFADNGHFWNWQK